MKNDTSKQLFAEAQRYIPGGVNSPVRAFKAVGGNPLFIQKARGSHLFDEDGNEFIDYVGSWGPLILGHTHPKVVKALRAAVELGTSYGAPTERETELARLIVEALPSVELVRFVNSGTEATMSALRLARAYTKRDKIVKFDGGYHGHADPLLVKAGSGATTLGQPDSAGVLSTVASGTISLPYNDLEAVKQAFATQGEQIAAVIVEPVAGNMGVIPPAEGYLAGLREITTSYGALLIFDEVITGFRVAYAGAQGVFGVTPDLTCLGKIIGGGLPVGAYGGRKDLMELMAPLGPVYQAGTLSGNPLAMTAGIVTLRDLQQSGVYETLEAGAQRLTSSIAAAAKQAGTALTINKVGSMFTVFFTDRRVIDYATAKTTDTARYAAFFNGLLERGVYFPPSQFETTFVSLAHCAKDLDDTAASAAEVLQVMR